MGGTISGVTGPTVGLGNHVALIPPLGLGNYNRCTLFMHLSKFCPMRANEGPYQGIRLKFCPQGRVISFACIK